MKINLHSYQQEAAQFMLERPHAAIFADPGLGKTVITLTALVTLQATDNIKALVVAPLHPMMSTWPSEISLWDHTQHLRHQICHGKNKQLKIDDHDIFLVNPEGLGKLLKQPEAEHLDVLVVDESTRFKSWSAQRSKTLKKYLKNFSRRYILTGTPTPNGLLDLFSQIYIVDQGATFGGAYTKFRAQYFQPRSHIQVGGRTVATAWDPNPGAEDVIQAAIAPLCLRLDGEKLLELPDFVYRDVQVNLPPPAAKFYDKFQKELFAQLDGGKPIMAASAGSAYGMCRQAAGGSVYDAETPSGVVELHGAKLDALQSIVEELSGKPVLVAFNYKHEKKRLLKKFPHACVIDGQSSSRESTEIIDAWNRGEVQILLAHPQSVSHGINLQKGPGRHIVWFTLTDNMENYEQFNRRIRRQGVTSRVFVLHIMARGTIDVVVSRRLRDKGARQKQLLDALLEWRNDNKKN